MRNCLLKGISVFCVAVLLCNGLFLQSAYAEPAASAGQQSVEFYRSQAYETYLDSYKDAVYPKTEIKIDGIEQLDANAESNYEVVENLGGRQKSSLVTKESGSVTFRFEVTQAGLYNMQIGYYPVEGKGAQIERTLYIDGEIPFEEARSILFYRRWVDIGEVEYSANGNEYRREQEEKPEWITFDVKSNGSNLDGYLKFYFSAGTHTITLQSVSEPMAISEITLCQLEEPKTYEEVLKTYQSEGYQEVSTETVPIKIQAEDPSAKSSATLYALEDRTSPINEPFDISKTVLNTIGGVGWSAQGEWLEWKVNVKNAGLYRLSIRAKQNYKSGSFSTRSVWIDNKLPFEEAANIKFRFNNQWQMVTAQMENGDPYLFYLSEGEHTIRLEVALGDHSELLRLVEDSVNELSGIYRKVIMLTGSMPDSLRDYKLKKNLPEIFTSMEDQIKTLNQVNDYLVKLSGKKGEESATIDKLLVLLKLFQEKPDKIPANLTYFNDNISALASWMLSVSEQPILMDYFVLDSPNAPKLKADASALSKIWVEIKSFFLSFVNDYNTIEDSAGAESASSMVELWLAGNAGRDQATSIKTLADNYFTEAEGVRLNIRLVDMDVLLRAVSASEGPDVAIFQAQSTPVNYAIRSALQNLSEFKDIDEVTSRFSESAMVPLTFNGNVYALPEQQTFLMMFYRKDVLYDLNLSVPNTWEDFYAAVPILQNNNLSVGLPSPVQTQSGGTATSLNDMLVALLYQNGINVYSENGDKCLLNRPEAVEVFTDWTELYTKYKIDKQINEVNRFRTGEAPIVISQYTFYNTLSVAAPEIKGLWGVAPIPGTMQEDGSINRSAGSTGTNVIMFGNAKDKEASWKFMKWWTSAEIQTLYGREIEILQGASARWPTANLEAMKNLPWSAEISKAINEQWKYVKGVPEVAGGYYVGRNVDNAIKQVINEGQNPRETILDYVDQINDEITYKRHELGLE